jgi:xanthine/uracil permease
MPSTRNVEMQKQKKQSQIEGAKISLTNSLFYQVDDCPPLMRNALYGIQWTMIFIPILIIITSISARAIELDDKGQVLFAQRVLLVTGVATLLQSLVGHKYPIQEGPATALLLSFVTIAPYGLQVIQGGMIVGGFFLLILGSLNLIKWIRPLFTDRVVGVILMLISFTLLPFLYRLIAGITPDCASGELSALLISLFLILIISLFSQVLPGFLKTISMFAGVLIGFFAFWALGRINFNSFSNSAWFNSPQNLVVGGSPHFFLPSIITFLFAYLAVTVNCIGSIYGIAEIVGKEDVEKRISRGIALTGVGGILGGLTGTIGTVSYSISPGVVLVSRVASRFALSMCGGMLVILSLVPKLGALFTSIPLPVVGAVLCVAMGSQIGAGIAIISKAKEKLKGRDYLVVGVPTLLGAIAGLLPREIYAPLPEAVSAILANGVVFGIILVLIMEHLLLRETG